MCGITGYWDFNPRSSNNLSANISAMTDSISHRGPDAGNYWIDGQFGIAIGQRRLAIIDLSANGAQPMHKQGKSLVPGFWLLVFSHTIQYAVYICVYIMYIYIYTAHTLCAKCPNH